MRKSRGSKAKFMKQFNVDFAFWMFSEYFASVFQKNVLQSPRPASARGVVANRHRT
jgi:hypothetical protein